MMLDKTILIAVAPNGARKTKKDHPNIPLTSLELAKTAKDCCNAGASMIHLHVRDPENQSHSLSSKFYKEALAEMNHKEILIQVTSESVNIYSAEEQFAMIHELKPRAVSIALREIESLNANTICEHFVRMKESDIHPQIILYNEFDLHNYHKYLDKGVLPGNSYPILLVIGKPTPEGSFTNSYLTKENIQGLRASSWMICAFGENEYTAAKRAISLGGHVRIGFENNDKLKNGSKAIDNAVLIKQIHQYLLDNDYKNASVAQANIIMTPNW